MQTPDWKEVRYDELSRLAESQLTSYEIVDEDTLIELGAAIMYSAAAARLHNSVFVSRIKVIGDMADFTIPKEPDWESLKVQLIAKIKSDPYALEICAKLLNFI